VLTDAHCHPFDLAVFLPNAENERRRLEICCAASASSPEEFMYCEQLSVQAKTASAAAMLPCFAVHPQSLLPNEAFPKERAFPLEKLERLDALAAQGRLAAVGETGFDLYNAAFRETETMQEKLFAAHIETALRCDLPMVIHARRAMHKIFAYSKMLKKCRAVIFHSWPGTAEEGEALLRRGINAYFSFGTTILLNHRQALRCCAAFPANRLLAETDAPFQPLRGKAYSGYSDIALVLAAISSLRNNAEVADMEKIIEENFKSAFSET